MPLSSQPKKHSSHRLYGGFVGTLQALQIIGYLIAVITGFGMGTTFANSFGGGEASVVAGVFLAIVFCFLAYISTQGFIAVIDLLSRIEQNIRQLKDDA